MDSKAIKGYLVGYDGDERYRIYVPELNRVMVSRDVYFQEKTKDCSQDVSPIQSQPSDTQQVETVSLPFGNIQTQKEVELPVEELPDDNDEPIQDDEIGDETIRDTSGSEYETGVDTDFEEQEHHEQPQQLQGRVLRNREELKRPDRYVGCALAAEEFMSDYVNPNTFQEAVQSQQCSEWRKAMDSEIQSHSENGTWVLAELPKGAKAIPCKWVFRVKTNPDGSLEKFKARLVIKGYSQRQGVDFDQTFSPVAKMSTIRSVLSIASSEDMHLAQFDVSTAFLYGELEETIYMKQPEGYNDDSGKVCLLKKSLYGLKQAPRCWNRRMENFLLKMGFKISEADPCLYIREHDNRKILLVLYVDDGLVAATNPEDLKLVISELKTEFKIVEKKADYFLGLEIEKSAGKIKIHQTAYAKKILEKFNFAECKSVSTPIVKGAESILSGKDSREVNFPYRQAIGALMYLMLGTRPDLAYTIGYLSRFLEKPSQENIIGVKRVFRYLAGSLNKGIVYDSNSKKEILECYSDADFNGCCRTGRSTTGIVTKYCGGAISWFSQRQPVVADSTTEAEIIAASEATKEVIWMQRLFSEIINLKEVPVLQVDNQAAIKLTQNPELHRRTKHIQRKHFFVREKVGEGLLDVQYVSTKKQLADLMTKALPKATLQQLSKQIGLY